MEVETPFPLNITCNPVGRGEGRCPAAPRRRNSRRSQGNGPHSGRALLF